MYTKCIVLYRTEDNYEQLDFRKAFVNKQSLDYYKYIIINQITRIQINKFKDSTL